MVEDLGTRNTVGFAPCNRNGDYIDIFDDLYPPITPLPPKEEDKSDGEDSDNDRNPSGGGS